MSVIENKLTFTSNLKNDTYKDSLLYHNYNNNNTLPSKPGTNQNSGENQNYLKQYISSCTFWGLVIILSILTVGNLILTCFILGVLRINHGMQAIEFLSQQDVTKFFGFADLDYIYKRDGYLQGFFKEPIEILGDGESVWFEVLNDDAKSANTDNFNYGSSRLDFGQGYTSVRNVDQFVVKTLKNDDLIYDAQAPTFKLASGVGSFNVPAVFAGKVVSPVDANLNVRSDYRIAFKGIEGTNIQGKEIHWFAQQDIILESVNRSIVLSGAEGVHVDLEHIPRVGVNASSHHHDHVAYKLCVCMPSGWLYRIQAARCNTLPDPCQSISNNY